MNNVVNSLVTLWYLLLNGNISLPAYRTTVPASEQGNYLLIRKESETNTPIKSAFVKNPIVILDIVTKFKSGNMIDDSLVDSIDNEVTNLVFLNPNTHNLGQIPGMYIGLVLREQTIYIDEDNGVNKLYRHITRYSHAIIQN